jgi:hypothetical protein
MAVVRLLWEQVDRVRLPAPRQPIPIIRAIIMASKYPIFDRSRLRIGSLSERINDLDISHWIGLDDPTPDFSHSDLPVLADRICRAKSTNSARILMMGGHVLRAGVNRHIIDLMERGFVDHVAMNGSVLIHDYELARVGATTESVAKYIKTGEFGLWKETGELNDIITEAAKRDEGLGENAGRRILEGAFPHKDLSIVAAAHRLSIPATVHVGVGYDIIHEHPNCDGAALGAASYRDFLIYAKTAERLEGGVMMSFGSAVMAPEVFLKALSMARNVALGEGKEIRRFATAVFDIVPMDGDFRAEPAKSDPAYYFRPRKTILVRTVADGGESFYFCGEHRATLPALRRELLKLN